MSEPTVQVPVSLIVRAVEGLLKAPGRDAVLACGELHALLSQPTPTAEHDEDCFAGEWNEAAGVTCVCTCGVEPPRIEDMAPGTTFTAQMIGSGRKHRLTAPDFGVQYHVADQDVWIHHRDIDPSTIRDVTPPKDAA